MEYFWDSQDLYRKIQGATKIAENEKDFEKKFKYLQLVDDMNALYYNYFFAPDFSNKTNLLNENIYSLISYDRFVPYITNSHSTFNSYINKVDEIKKKYKRDISTLEEFQKVPFSHEEKMTLIHDFFKDLDSELFNFFLKLYNLRKTNVWFVDAKAKVSRSDCLSLAIINESFLRVCGGNTIEVITNLAHECGHAISFLMNPSWNYNNEKDFFAEVESFFIELLSMDYFYLTTRNEDIELQKQELFSVMATVEDALTMQEFITEIYLKNGLKKDSTFFKKLKTELMINKNIFNNIMQVAFENDGTYLLSFLVAIELFHLYKQDKELAIDYFKKIIMCPIEKDRIIIINKHLEIGKNLDKYCQETILEYEKELKRRNLKK